MLVRYRFPVTGRLRLEFSFPVRSELFTYAFDVDDLGLVTHITATARVTDRSSWPVITPDPEPGIRAHIQLTSPFLSRLRRDLRAAAGILALYGVDDISVEQPLEQWEAETPEEKEALSIYSFEMTKQPQPPEKLQRVSFDLVARALLAANRATDFEAALNFFRKGKLDTTAEQYIDAVLDFLFMIETTYANGTFRKAQVENEYLNSAELHSLIQKAAGDRFLLQVVERNSRMAESFRTNYLNRSSTEIIKYLVKLRGELHHHTSRRSGIWHPADHIRFGADALFLQQLCLDVAFAIASPTVFDNEIARAYQAQAHSAATSGELKVHRK